MDIDNIKYIDGFNYTCCYYRGDFNTSPSSGGLNPYRERFTSFEQAAQHTGIRLETLIENINWEKMTITDEGKLLKSTIRYGEWRFELTLRGNQ